MVSVVILPRKVYFFLPRVSHFIIALQMLSTRRGSKWCSCYGWLWVFPKPFYLNSSWWKTALFLHWLHSKRGRAILLHLGRRRSSGTPWAKMPWGGWNVLHHGLYRLYNPHRALFFIGTAELLKMVGHGGGGETNWLENVFKVRLIRFDVQCTLYIMDSWLHSEVDFIGNRCHQNVGRPKPKQNCRRDEKYKFNVYNVVRLNRSA